MVVRTTPPAPPCRAASLTSTGRWMHSRQQENEVAATSNRATSTGSSTVRQVRPRGTSLPAPTPSTVWHADDLLTLRSGSDTTQDWNSGGDCTGNAAQEPGRSRRCDGTSPGGFTLKTLQHCLALCPQTSRSERTVWPCVWPGEGRLSDRKDLLTCVPIVEFADPGCEDGREVPTTPTRIGLQERSTYNGRNIVGRSALVTRWRGLMKGLRFSAVPPSRYRKVSSVRRIFQ